MAARPGISTRRACKWNGPRAAAVFRVAQDRRAEAGAMDAQLVRPPGARLELELGGAPAATAQ